MVIIDRVVAIAVVAALAIVALFAVKSQFLNQRLIALAKQFRLHHLLALFALGGMAVHVLLAFATDWPESLTTYFSFSDIAIAAGWLALIVFVTITVSSWIAALAYRQWYAIHLLALPAYALMAIHALLLSQSRTTDFYVTVALLAIVTLIFGRIFIDRFTSTNSRSFRITENKILSPGWSELHLLAESTAPTRELPAGSIVYLRFVGNSFSRQWHPFSIASCRHESEVRLLIKGLGADTRHLTAGTQPNFVRMRGPFREFTPDFSREQIWIAAGIGIAPFSGYAACIARQSHEQVWLFHFMEDEAQSLDINNYCASQFRTASLTQKSALVLSGQTPNLQDVLQTARDHTSGQFIVCGPPRFMRYVRHALIAAGIDRRNINTEEFLPW